jgi:tRNA pseudouridine38-40 synthase
VRGSGRCASGSTSRTKVPISPGGGATGFRTVEGRTLREALAKLYPGYENLAVAGRTDAGVHALGQVASVDVSGGRRRPRRPGAEHGAPRRSLVTASAEAHPTSTPAARPARGATATASGGAVPPRRSSGAAAVVPAPIEEAKLADSADLLLGEHDFTAFTPTETQHLVFKRKVKAASWQPARRRARARDTADSFLRHMVRTLVGTMLEQSRPRFSTLLEGRPRAEAARPRRPGGSTSSRSSTDEARDICPHVAALADPRADAGLPGRDVCCSHARRPGRLPRLVRMMAASDPSRSSPVPSVRSSRSGGRSGASSAGTLRVRSRLEGAVAPRPAAPTCATPGPGRSSTGSHRPLYLTGGEFAAEIANRTVHGVMHLGWVTDGSGVYHGQMAVLVKAERPARTAYHRPRSRRSGTWSSTRR